MAISYFDRKVEEPTLQKFENSLTATTFKLWKTFTGNIAAVYPKVTYQWEYLSKRIGWFLECKINGESLFFIVPKELYFQVNFIFDDELFESVQSSNLPQPIIKYILSAEHIDRGYSFYMEVKDVQDLETVEMLLQMQYDAHLQDEKE